MRITKEKIGNYAENILIFLEEERIKSLKDLEDRLGNNYLLDNEKSIALELTLRPSHVLPVITLSLTVHEEGIPIEIRAHDKLDYWHCVVKCYEELPDYQTFIRDKFDNKAQFKIR